MYHFFHFCVRSFHWCSSLGLSHPITAPLGRVSFPMGDHREQNERVSAPSHHAFVMPQAQLSWFGPCGVACSLGEIFNSGKY